MTNKREPDKVPSAMGHKVSDADEGYRILSELLAGFLLFGGLGWLGDHFLHTVYLTPAGMILGFALSIYVIIKRHASSDHDVTTQSTDRRAGRGDQ